MKWHDCISYAWSHRVESGVCAWCWLLTILGEYVVSSEMGQCPKLRLTVVLNNNNTKSRVFGVKQDGVDPSSPRLG